MNTNNHHAPYTIVGHVTLISDGCYQWHTEYGVRRGFVTTLSTATAIVKEWHKQFRRKYPHLSAMAGDTDIQREVKQIRDEEIGDDYLR